MTYDEMIDLLRKGHVDVEHFDQEGEKCLRELFDEVTNKEVHLQYMPARDENPAYIARCALTVAISIYVPSARLQYLETKRTFRSGRTVERRRDWTITETCRRGETLHDSAVRAVLEELGLAVSEDDFHFIPYQQFPKPYCSSVYPGLKSHTMIQRMELWRHEPLWRESVKVVQDQSKFVTIESFPFLVRAA